MHPADDADPRYLASLGQVNDIVESLIAHADYIFGIGLPSAVQSTNVAQKLVGIVCCCVSFSPILHARVVFQNAQATADNSGGTASQSDDVAARPPVSTKVTMRAFDFFDFF